MNAEVHQEMGECPVPRIAIVCQNTLTAMGMSQLLTSVIPVVKICTYRSWEELSSQCPEDFVHYFITPDILLQDFQFFHERASKTFLITEQTDSHLLPREFRRINPSLPEDELTKVFLRMEQSAHGKGQHIPEKIRRQLMSEQGQTELTPRETEILKEVARGKLNKEIAESLHISLTTVISHRKNITGKLNIKSASGLTIYAVTHGLLNIDEI